MKDWTSREMVHKGDDYKVRVSCRDGERDVVITLREIDDAIFDSDVRCCGECECSIEPDGVCHNGWPSILLALGVI
jgi:hypothetical protein